MEVNTCQFGLSFAVSIHCLHGIRAQWEGGTGQFLWGEDSDRVTQSALQVLVCGGAAAYTLLRIHYEADLKGGGSANVCVCACVCCVRVC